MIASVQVEEFAFATTAFILLGSHVIVVECDDSNTTGFRDTHATVRYDRRVGSSSSRRRGNRDGEGNGFALVTDGDRQTAATEGGGDRFGWVRQGTEFVTLVKLVDLFTSTIPVGLGSHARTVNQLERIGKLGNGTCRDLGNCACLRQNGGRKEDQGNERGNHPGSGLPKDIMSKGPPVAPGANATHQKARPAYYRW